MVINQWSIIIESQLVRVVELMIKPKAVQVVYVDWNPICVVRWLSCAELKIKNFQVIISSKNTFLNLIKT